jgi:hypothetical protein
LLDLGLNTSADPLNSGRILVGSGLGSDLRTIVSGQILPDGLDVSIPAGRIYWTNMGIPSANDGEIRSCKLNGSDIQTIVSKGLVHTPKQLVLDPTGTKLYFCDREGLRVIRCNMDGSELEVLVRNGEWRDQNNIQDQTNWCVGIAISPKENKFYWTQKGPSKGGKGRIFRANIETPIGTDSSTRNDIEVVLANLPEPIDLDIDAESETLYWTDRGDPPTGNTLNKLQLGKPSGQNKPTPKILARNMHEAIGLKLDLKNQHIYITDLGGTVYRSDMSGGNKKKVYDTEACFAGISLVHI